MAKDFTNIYRRYKGQWVALLDDEQTVVGSGKTLKTALGKARKKGYEKPIVMRMPSKILPYVGLS